MPAPCPSCRATVADEAKFCPRCGAAMTRTIAPAEPTHLGLKPAPIPKLGLVVIAAVVIGPAALIAGIVFSITPLIYIGAAIIIVLAALIFLGS